MSETHKNSDLVAQNANMLSRSDFAQLGEVPEVLEWLANIPNELTRTSYKNDVQQFSKFVGLENPNDFRLVKRAHVIAWREQLTNRELGAATIRRKMSSLSSLFDYLCEKNSIEGNPVNGVKRPTEGANVGKTPALSKEQAKALFNAPEGDSIKALRDRAILATFLLHGARKMETAKLKIGDLQYREGVPHFQFKGKGGKIRFVAINPIALKRINEYLEADGRVDHFKEYLFRPIKNNVTRNLETHLSASGLYQLVTNYGREVGIPRQSLQVHCLRATAVTLALKNGAELPEVQEWAGHSDISTTRMYDKRNFDVEDSPSFKVIL